MEAEISGQLMDSKRLAHILREGAKAEREQLKKPPSEEIDIFAEAEREEAERAVLAALGGPKAVRAMMEEAKSPDNVAYTVDEFMAHLASLPDPEAG